MFSISKIQGTSDVDGNSKHSGVSKGVLFPECFGRKKKKGKLLISEVLFNFFVCFSFSFRSFLPIYFVKYATFILIRVQHVSAL